MGKSEDQLKKRTKEVQKSPISPVWLCEFSVCCRHMVFLLTSAYSVLLGFIVFGGLFVEVLSRFFLGR